MIPRTAEKKQLGSDVQTRKHRPDYTLLILVSILLGIGLIVVYAISPALAAQGGGVGENYFVSRQFIAIIIGFLAFFLAGKIPLKFWERYQIVIIILAILLSLSTLAFGGTGNRWLQLGTFSFQPVEFVKFVLVVVGASFLARVAAEGRLNKLSAFKPLIITFAIFSVILVGLQKDLGSTFVLFAMAGVMAFVAGVPMKRLMIFGIVALVLGTAAISSTALPAISLIALTMGMPPTLSSMYSHASAVILFLSNACMYSLVRCPGCSAEIRVCPG